MRESPYQEAIRTGERQGARTSILTVLETRFGAKVAVTVADAVNAIEDLEHLRSLILTAVRCANLDEFRRAAATPPARSARVRRRR